MTQQQTNRKKRLGNSLYSFIPLLIVGTLFFGYPENHNGVDSTQNTEEVMKSLDNYIGKWKSDTKKNTGNTFYFMINLEYFNASEVKSIVKMTITQHSENGAEALLWEGFKGVNSIENEVYYYGFSPSGRVGMGGLYISKEGLVTEYTGLTIAGAVKIKDVLTDVKNDKYKSTTYMKREGSDWAEISKDEWTKIN